MLSGHTDIPARRRRAGREIVIQCVSPAPTCRSRQISPTKAHGEGAEPEGVKERWAALGEDLVDGSDDGAGKVQLVNEPGWKQEVVEPLRGRTAIVPCCWSAMGHTCAVCEESLRK